MTTRRTKAHPRFTLPIWKRDGAGYWAERADLDAAVVAGGHDELTLRWRLGVGYRYLDELRAGKRIDGWAAAHVDDGISPERALPPGFGEMACKGPNG